MPRVTESKASKPYKCGLTGRDIAPGETVYRWTPYRQRTRIASRYPRPSELTGSDKLSRLYGARETLEDTVGRLRGEAITSAEDAVSSVESLKDELESAKNEAEEVGSEYQDAADAMDGRLNAADMEEKVGECESWAEALGAAVDTLDELLSEYREGDADDGEPDDDPPTSTVAVEAPTATSGEEPPPPPLTDQERERLETLLNGALDAVEEAAGELTL